MVIAPEWELDQDGNCPRTEAWDEEKQTWPLDSYNAAFVIHRLRGSRESLGSILWGCARGLQVAMKPKAVAISRMVARLIVHSENSISNLVKSNKISIQSHFSFQRDLASNGIPFIWCKINRKSLITIEFGSL